MTGGAESGAGPLGTRAGPIFGALAGIATGGLGWGWFEAGWVRLEEKPLELRGRRVYIAGADPRSVWVKSRRQPRDLAVSRADADLRILIAHYPDLIDDLPAGAFDLVVAGHMHDGQICLPYPGGKLRLAHLRARYTRGVYRRPGGVMHVSAGLGTTFVPFRFAARPEATELVLQGTR